MPIVDTENELSVDLSAVSFDTSAFIGAGESFYSPQFNSLIALMGPSLSLVMPQVIVEEILEKMDERYVHARRYLSYQIANLIPPDMAYDLETEVTKIFEHREKTYAPLREETRERFNDLPCHRITIPYEYIGTPELFSHYFAMHPPFSRTEDISYTAPYKRVSNGRIRKEFPDAHALMSLEKWAKDHSINILVASSDKHWKSFCEKSDLLFLVTKFSDVIKAFKDYGATERRLLNFLRGEGWRGEFIARYEDFVKGSQTYVAQYFGLSGRQWVDRFYDTLMQERNLEKIRVLAQTDFDLKFEMPFEFDGSIHDEAPIIAESRKFRGSGLMTIGAVENGTGAFMSFQILNINYLEVSKV